MYNQLALIGRLTEDPQLVVLESGTKTSRITLAVNRDFKSEDGELGVEFIPVQLWNYVAENVCEYLKKGSLVFARCRVVPRTLDIEGKKVRTIEVYGDRIIYLCSPREAENKTN